jgi:hypothetical protein
MTSRLSCRDELLTALVCCLCSTGRMSLSIAHADRFGRLLPAHLLCHALRFLDAGCWASKACVSRTWSASLVADLLWKQAFESLFHLGDCEFLPSVARQTSWRARLRERTERELAMFDARQPCAQTAVALNLKTCYIRPHRISYCPDLCELVVEDTNGEGGVGGMVSPLLCTWGLPCFMQRSCP